MAIAFVQAATGTQLDTSQTSLAISITTSANRALVAAIALNSNTQVSSITDDGGNTWARATAQNNGTGERTELWRSDGRAAAVGSVTINWAASGSKVAAVVGEYSGDPFPAAQVGVTSATTNNPTRNMTTAQASSFVIAGIGQVGSLTFVQGTGNLRAQAKTTGGSDITCGLVDNTSTPIAVVGTSVTNGGTVAAWTVCQMEHRWFNLSDSMNSWGDSMGYRGMLVTQVASEVLAQGTPLQRVTQVVVEVMAKRPSSVQPHISIMT